MKNIIKRLKKETNNLENIIYREKKFFFRKIHIIYNETLISSNTVSDFVLRSLNKIYIPTYNNIINKISNFKYKEINTYEDMIYHLNR